MKIITSSLLLTLLLAVASQADIALNAPGVPIGSVSATSVPFRNTYTLPNSYRFIFSGTQAQGTTTGAPGSSCTQGNGGLVDFKAFVSATGSSTPTTGAVQINFTNIQTFNASPLKTLTLTPAVTFVGSTAPISVQLVWQGEGNGQKPTGFFNILGEYQQVPPKPTGTLSFPYGQWQLKASGSTNPDPQGTMTITRQ